MIELLDFKKSSLTIESPYIIYNAICEPLSFSATLGFIPFIPTSRLKKFSTVLLLLPSAPTGRIKIHGRTATRSVTTEEGKRTGGPRVEREE